MKANVGMLYPVAAPVATYTPYSGITYGNGKVVSEARGANLSWETTDGEFRGDDIRLDSDHRPIGYTLDFESTGIQDDVLVMLLGEVKDSNDVYHTTGAPAPDMGFGYIKHQRDNSSGTVVETYTAIWYHKIKFKQIDEDVKTMERNIEWSGETINGTGDGVFLEANATHPDFREHKSFSTAALAKAFLNGKANIS